MAHREQACSRRATGRGSEGIRGGRSDFLRNARWGGRAGSPFDFATVEAGRAERLSLHRRPPHCKAEFRGRVPFVDPYLQPGEHWQKISPEVSPLRRELCGWVSYSLYVSRAMASRPIFGAPMNCRWSLSSAFWTVTSRRRPGTVGQKRRAVPRTGIAPAIPMARNEARPLTSTSTPLCPGRCSRPRSPRL